MDLDNYREATKQMMEKQKNALTAFLEDKDHLDVSGNSLLVMHKDQEILRHVTGDVTRDTLFRIYSMTKVVTVVSALQLYEQGRFAMEDELGDYIPEFKHMKVWNEDKTKAVEAKNKIRIRDLFSMSSGLTYEGESGETPKELLKIKQRLEKEKPGEGYTTLEYVKAMSQATLDFEPGTHWCYGLSHDVLGGLIEVLSGQTLGEYMKENIFIPLGMEHTFFRCPEQLKDKMATYQAAVGEDDKFGINAKYESGGGGLLSTVDDYMIFANTLTRGGVSEKGVRILGRKIIDLMRMDQLNEVQKKDFNWDYLTGYSYGLGVRTNVDPALSAIPGSKGEFGWCGMLGTYVLMDPEEQLTVVYMHQRFPNLEKYLQTHIRPMIYAMIE